MGMMSAVADAITKGPEGQSSDGFSYASMSIAGIDPRDPSKILNMGGLGGESLAERSFQYWPESISDSIDIGWSFKDIPGASTGLAQWSSNNGRTISFDVPFHRFIRPQASWSIQEKAKDPLGASNAGGVYPRDNREHNVDIQYELKYLRAYCYPLYAEVSGITGAFPPPVAILNIPGLGLNESGGDAIFALMTGCDITYLLLFNDGTPRRANVSLTFRQIVQREEGVVFKGLNGGYAFGDSELPNNNIGYKAGISDGSKVL